MSLQAFWNKDATNETLMNAGFQEVLFTSSIQEFKYSKTQ